MLSNSQTDWLYTGTQEHSPQPGKTSMWQMLNSYSLTCQPKGQSHTPFICSSEAQLLFHSWWMMDVIVSVQATPQKSPDILRITLFSSWHTPVLPSVDSRVLPSAPRPHPMLTYSPSQKCGGCASAPRRSPRAPGVWELWPGPAAPNCSWRHGSTVCHSPATAASSAPEKCPLLCLTSLQRQDGKLQWATCQASVLREQSCFTQPWAQKPSIMSRWFFFIPPRI